MKALIEAIEQAKSHKDVNKLIKDIEKYIENPPTSTRQWALKFGINPNTFKYRAAISGAGCQIGQSRILDWLEAEELAKK